MTYSLIAQRPGFLIADKDVDRVCDVGRAGRKIIDETGFSSQQEYNPRRGRRIANILNDMFERTHFEGKRILELGPGHYAFALLARHLGAEVVCIERDPAFVSLGRHLGFEIIDQDFHTLSPDQFEQSFDGLFVKGTFNACNPKDESEISEFVERITNLLWPEAWAWFVTVNKTASPPEGWKMGQFVDHRVELQRQAFADHGWDVSMMMGEEARPRYALKYSNSHYLFTRNLEISGAVRAPAPNNTTNSETDSSSVKASAKITFNKVYKPNRPTAEYHDNSWRYFTDCIEILKRRGAVFITMSDAYAGRFDKDKINIILDHHIDFYPVETEVMARWERENGVVSSIYLFNHSPYTDYGQSHPWSLKDLNISFYQELERAGFEIGYHSNAVGQARRLLKSGIPLYSKQVPVDVLAKARGIFEEDVKALRQHFNIRSFVPHGGGEGNVFLTDIPESCSDLVWAYNGRKNAEHENPPRWNNFSDSNTFYAQRMTSGGATYIARIDNLHLFALLAEPGLNHILLHCGRYARWMPYDLYDGPTPLSEDDCESITYRLPENMKPPLSARKLMGETGSSVTSSEKYYVLTDDVEVLQKHMAASDLVTPTFLYHRRITEEEKSAYKVPRGVDKAEFPLPRQDQEFLEAYRGFINLAYTPSVIKHLAKGSYPLDRCDLRHVLSDDFKDADALAAIARRIPADGRVRLCVNVRADRAEKWVRRANAALNNIEGAEVNTNLSPADQATSRLIVSVQASEIPAQKESMLNLERLSPRMLFGRSRGQ